MIYTKSNAARTLGQVYSRVKWVQEFWKVVNVCLTGGKPRFVSKVAFKQAFVAFRKEGSKSVLVKRVSASKPLFKALGKTDLYDLEATPTGITCNCEDYYYQTIRLNSHTHCCKHGYAVLTMLGFNSLGDYLKTTLAGV